MNEQSEQLDGDSEPDLTVRLYSTGFRGPCQWQATLELSAQQLVPPRVIADVAANRWETVWAMIHLAMRDVLPTDDGDEDE